MYTIETGIPIPAPLGGRGKPPGPLSTAIKTMNCDDSFLIPNAKKTTTSNAHLAAKKHGVKIKTRTVEGGLRIWRTS